MNEILLSVKNVKWNSPEKEILKGIDLELVTDRISVLCGLEESGKSLLLKIIAGIEPPDQGSIIYDGVDLFNADEKRVLEIRKKLAFVFEDGVHLSNLIIRENLLLPFKYHYDKFDLNYLMSEINRYLKFFGIGNVMEERPAQISRSKLKLLAFIRAAITDPELIVIDNPLFNLELINQIQVLKFLQQLKDKHKTMLITSGSRDLIENLADELLIIKEGMITARISRSSSEFQSMLDNLELSDLKGV